MYPCVARVHSAPGCTRYALKRHGEPTAPKKDVPKRNTGSVWSAYVATRDQPANRYDAATAFEAAMRGDEVVGIRVGNANGATVRPLSLRRASLTAFLQHVQASHGSSARTHCSATWSSTIRAGVVGA